MQAGQIHHYYASCSWAGSTGAGYRVYDRAHEVRIRSVPVPLALSADPAFLGGPGRLNPEQLLLAAATSCQLLSFLAVAARAGIDVLACAGEAEAVMPETPRPTRISEIRLRPDITVHAPATEERERTGDRTDPLRENRHFDVLGFVRTPSERARSSRLGLTRSFGG